MVGSAGLIGSLGSDESVDGAENRAGSGGQADSGWRPLLLGNGMLPVMLRGSAHDQEVPRMQRPGGRHLSLTGERLVAHDEAAGATEADDGHQGVDVGTTDSVGVPSHTVRPVAIEVAEQAGEATQVVLFQYRDDVGDHSGYQRVIEFEPRRQPRFVEPLSVHEPLTLTPVEIGRHHIEQGVGPHDEPVDTVNPATWVELLADKNWITVDARFGATARKLGEQAEWEWSASVGGSFTLRRRDAVGFDTVGIHPDSLSEHQFESTGNLPLRALGRQTVSLHPEGWFPQGRYPGYGSCRPGSGNGSLLVRMNSTSSNSSRSASNSLMTSTSGEPYPSSKVTT